MFPLLRIEKCKLGNLKDLTTHTNFSFTVNKKKQLLVQSGML